jgi:hypothetical protein
LFGSRARAPAGDRVGGDAVKPGGERRIAPLEAVQVCQRAVEDLGSKIFGLVTIADAAGNEGVNSVEMGLLEVGEASRIALRGLHKAALRVFGCHGGLARHRP